MSGRGIRKCRSFGMYLNIYDFQCKAGRYISGFTYLRTKVTTNQKQGVDLPKPNRKELKNETKKTHQATKGKVKSAKQHQKEI